jgi:hypothetical protein
MAAARRFELGARPEREQSSRTICHTAGNRQNENISRSRARLDRLVSVGAAANQNLVVDRRENLTMMPPRSVGGRLSGHSTRRMYVRQLGWLFSNKLEMRLSAWGMQFALPVIIVAPYAVRRFSPGARE